MFTLLDNSKYMINRKCDYLKKRHFKRIGIRIMFGAFKIIKRNNTSMLNLRDTWYD